jgi:hypothetical protein
MRRAFRNQKAKARADLLLGSVSGRPFAAPCHTPFANHFDWRDTIKPLHS